MCDKNHSSKLSYRFISSSCVPAGLLYGMYLCKGCPTPRSGPGRASGRGDIGNSGEAVDAREVGPLPLVMFELL